MKALNFDLKTLCLRARDGSHATQADRFRTLQLVAGQLAELGYKLQSAHGIKPKHVEALVDRWQGEGLGTGTLKNRLACLRWWAEKVGKPSIMQTNEAYGVGRRETFKGNRALRLDAATLAKVQDPHIRMALRLQAAFGLRREEALKFRPSVADLGNRLALQASWCKGGRYREIPILTDRQRALLDECHKLAGKGSLIPVGKTYIQQLHTYNAQALKAGLNGLHGLRHAYAQARYRLLTGEAAPVAGGRRGSELAPDQKARDYQARLTVAQELGHNRVDVSAAYLGGRR